LGGLYAADDGQVAVMAKRVGKLRLVSSQAQPNRPQYPLPIWEVAAEVDRVYGHPDPEVREKLADLLDSFRTNGKPNLQDWLQAMVMISTRLLFLIGDDDGRRNEGVEAFARGMRAVMMDHQMCQHGMGSWGPKQRPKPSI
jgi:hypothetical protein